MKEEKILLVNLHRQAYCKKLRLKSVSNEFIFSSSAGYDDHSNCIVNPKRIDAKKSNK